MYAVDEGGPSGNQCTLNNSGVFVATSSNGGASWGTPIQVSSGSNSTQTIEPAIAVDRTNNRIYVASAKLDFALAGCAGAPDSSQITLTWSSDGGTNWAPPRRVSPLATSGHYRSPSLAVLPDGRVIVAFRDDAPTGPQIETETCTFFPSPPAANYCGAPTAGLVGASTLVGDATAPALADGLAGAPTPSVIAAGGRVTVAWHAAPGRPCARSPRSPQRRRDFGSPLPIDPTGGATRSHPSSRPPPGTRRRRVSLGSRRKRHRGATSASAPPPLPSATSEAWSKPVVVQGAGASRPSPSRARRAPSAAGWESRRLQCRRC